MQHHCPGMDICAMVSLYVLLKYIWVKVTYRDVVFAPFFSRVHWVSKSTCTIHLHRHCQTVAQTVLFRFLKSLVLRGWSNLTLLLQPRPECIDRTFGYFWILGSWLANSQVYLVWSKSELQQLKLKKNESTIFCWMFNCVCACVKQLNVTNMKCCAWKSCVQE